MVTQCGESENENHRRSDDDSGSCRTLGNFCDHNKGQKGLPPRFKEGEEFRKSGRTWLITKAGMERLYGPEKEGKE